MMNTPCRAASSRRYEDDIVRVEGGTDELVEAINTTDGLCVVLIGAVQYYSGRVVRCVANSRAEPLMRRALS